MKKRGRQKTGLPPGSVVYTGEKRSEQIRITFYGYDSESVSHFEADSLKQAIDSFGDGVNWLNIDGLHETSLIEQVGSRFGIHPLVLEDVANTGQRPKVEVFDDYIYAVLKMLTYDRQAQSVCCEQVSLILAEGLVVSLQEAAGDVLEPVRQRIAGGKTRLRKLKADYLFYSIIDSIIDNYFEVLEAVSDRVEQLQQQIADDPTEETLMQIHHTKKQILAIKKAVWPLREMVNGLQKTDSELIEDSTSPFLRDLYDHTIQLIDTTESMRDMIGGILDMYLSVISNRMNSIMQVLTTIATIFIPLTFIAGIYGMNFENMPELGWRLSYPVGFWTVIVIMVIGMLVYFKRKKWF